MKDLKFNLKDKDLNSSGCFRLIEAVIWNCFTDPYRGSEYEIKQRIETRINFAKYGKLIHHWANVSEYDEERVRNRIIKFNSLPREDLIKEYSKFN